MALHGAQGPLINTFANFYFMVRRCFSQFNYVWRALFIGSAVGLAVAAEPAKIVPFASQRFPRSPTASTKASLPIRQTSAR